MYICAHGFDICVEESQDVRSVEQDVILSQKHYINVGLVHIGHGLLRIDGKLNKLQKKEVHFMVSEIGC
jgi:hypothetical protein